MINVITIFYEIIFKKLLWDSNHAQLVAIINDAQVFLGA